jgi:hypothetical protein
MVFYFDRALWGLPALFFWNASGNQRSPIAWIALCRKMNKQDMLQWATHGHDGTSVIIIAPLNWFVFSTSNPLS